VPWRKLFIETDRYKTHLPNLCWSGWVKERVQARRGIFAWSDPGSEVFLGRKAGGDEERFL
jgi:hypothetical protein